MASDTEGYEAAWATAPEFLRPCSLMNCKQIAELMCYPQDIRKALIRVSAPAWLRLCEGSGVSTTRASQLYNLGRFSLVLGGQLCNIEIVPDADNDVIQIGATEA